MPVRSIRLLACGFCLAALLLRPARGDDPIRELQDAYVARKDEKATRAYHFGSQGTGDVFSNHTTLTNRLIPVYVFGR